MPSLPSPGDVHVNRPLTNIAIAFMQNEANFAAGGRVFPMVPVSKQSDLYFVWNREHFNRDDAGLRGPGAEAHITDLALATASYNCNVYAVAKLLSDQERANQDDPLNLERTSSEVVAQKLLIRREKQWVDTAFKTTVWTGSTTATDLVGGVDFVQWSNYGASDPVTDIRTQIFQLARIPGVNPRQMKLVLGPAVFQKLLDHPDFLERYEQVQPAILNEALLAGVLGIGEVIVPMASYNSAKEGAAENLQFIYGKNALLLYCPATPGINVPSAGYMFTWAGLVGSEGQGMRIKRYRREEKASDQIEGETAFDPKVVSPTLGVFFSNAVA